MASGDTARFYFMSGLPRSGSRLLANILAQNNRIHTTGTSGVLDVILNIRLAWGEIKEMKASPNDGALLRVMAGVLESFYKDIKRPVVVDSCRGWTHVIELIEAGLDRPIKILVPVRDVRDILSSLEKLYRKNYLRHEEFGAAYAQCQTVEGRCAYRLQFEQELGMAHQRIRSAIQRGFRDRLHFIQYADLTTKPEQTLSEIYSFLDEPDFAHDFNNIDQTIFEDDSVWGRGDLHTIRRKVEPAPSDWLDVLGSFAEPYGSLNFHEV